MKFRKQRRSRRIRYVNPDTGKHGPWVHATGESRRTRRENSKPKSNFKGKNSLGRRKRLQERDTVRQAAREMVGAV